MTETIFKPRKCRRCGALILAGRCEGMSWLADVPAVPGEHAKVLKAHGVTLLVIEVRLSGLHASIWDPGGQQLARPGTWLVAPHVCGSAHSQNDHGGK